MRSLRSNHPVQACLRGQDAGGRPPAQTLADFSEGAEHPSLTLANGPGHRWDLAVHERHLAQTYIPSQRQLSLSPMAWLYLCSPTPSARCGQLHPKRPSAPRVQPARHVSWTVTHASPVSGLCCPCGPAPCSLLRSHFRPVPRERVTFTFSSVSTFRPLLCFASTNRQMEEKNRATAERHTQRNSVLGRTLVYSFHLCQAFLWLVLVIAGLRTEWVCVLTVIVLRF